jgi:hypothetical protein
MPKELKHKLEDTISLLKSQVIDSFSHCMMPKKLKQELEDTISSFKSQVMDSFFALYDA